MILISHRGNIDGPNIFYENSPNYIVAALDGGFNVEIDVWFIKNKFYLGHDNPQYVIDYNFLLNTKLWCHAKNIDALTEMAKYDIHFFWHEKDLFTLTSKKYIWAYPSEQININTIIVLPEKFNVDIKNAKGVCSDYILNYLKKHD